MRITTSDLKLTLAYDGTSFYGWQKTDTGPSIESALELALQQILQQNIHLQAASRTDRGVHALGQVVNVLVAHEKDLDIKKLQLSLNALLPNEIVCTSIEIVNPSFHPTFDVQNKEYSYEICSSAFQFPRHRLYSWHYPTPLNIESMKQAATILIGTHDFKAFTNQKKNEPYESTVRTIDSILIENLPDERLKITIQGPHFLYKMVRNIVGTLVYIGCGKLQLSDLKVILEQKERALAGMTAPAHGLTLVTVKYEKESSRAAKIPEILE